MLQEKIRLCKMAIEGNVRLMGVLKDILKDSTVSEETKSMTRGTLVTAEEKDKRERAELAQLEKGATP